MRPKKNSVQMKFWNINQLKETLYNCKTSGATKRKIERILQERRDKGFDFVQAFFNLSKNKFWELAQWQLYREGKAKKYGTGKHTKFYIDNPLDVFDKMIEVKKRYDKVCEATSKNSRQTTADIKKEVAEWKR